MIEGRISLDYSKQYGMLPPCASGYLHAATLLQTCLSTVNNFIAMWRWGAQDILELPLLAASSKMETAPMAGKT